MSRAAGSGNLQGLEDVYRKLLDDDGDDDDGIFVVVVVSIEFVFWLTCPLLATGF